MDDSDHPRAAPTASIPILADDEPADLRHEWASYDNDLPPFPTPHGAAGRLWVPVWAVYKAVEAEILAANVQSPRDAVVVQRPADTPPEG